MPSTPNTWDSMLTKSSSPSTITTRLPVSVGTGAAPDWSVSQNWLSRWLREPSAMSTSSSRVNASNPSTGSGAASTSPNALRMPEALAHVSLVSYIASESRTSVAPAVTLRLPSRSTSAVRIRIGASARGMPSSSRPIRAATAA